MFRITVKVNKCEKYQVQNVLLLTWTEVSRKNVGQQGYVLLIKSLRVKYEKSTTSTRRHVVKFSRVLFVNITAILFVNISTKSNEFIVKWRKFIKQEYF